MRNTTFFLLLIGIVELCFPQANPFKAVDFNNEEYTLVGIKWHKSEPNEIMRELGDWYLNDPDVLNGLKNDWVFQEPGKKYACGYHYRICLIKGGKIVKEFMVNLDCEEVRIGKNYYVFNPDLLTSISSNFLRLHERVLTFSELKEARKQYTALSKDSGVVVVDKPPWLRYQGSFQFTYSCREVIGDCDELEDSIKVKLASELTSKFPNENFQIYSYGFSSDEIYYKVDCDKNLYDKFDLKNTVKQNWEAFALRLRVFNKKP